MTGDKLPGAASPNAGRMPIAGSARRIRQGDLGFLPVLAALVAVFVVFHLANPYFLTPRNLSNLALQVGVLGVMALGVCLVLFIGEIDLSAGSVAGLCAVVLVILSSRFGFPGTFAITAAVLLGAVVGWMHGTWISLVGAPSFIVTLTGLLVWQGVQRMLVGNQIGQILIDDPLVTGIAWTFMPDWLSLVLVSSICCGSLVYFLLQSKSGQGMALSSRAALAAEIAIFPTLAVVIYVVLSQHSGVPVLLVILGMLAIILSIVTEQTPFGVHVFAVGGNAEAARRAGINVSRIRIILFSACSAMAALSGVIAVSRQFAADSNTGGGNLILDAIAAAVIGGTSLFGGRGRILGALLGALVIGSVANGLDLLGQSANVKSIITGLILLASVSLDMIARKRRIRSGTAGA